MMAPGPIADFDPDFASPSEWAAMYRACGLQVIPCYAPSEVAKGASWKRPKLSEWTEFQGSLVPDAVFARWYGAAGEHSARDNMGILTGQASGNVFVIDLDDQKGPAAGEWWRGILAVHNNGIEPETWQQRTGGGGRQIVFRAPADWQAPTNRTTINVDIRGQGGFAVVPPSLHESTKNYEWEPVCAPYEIEIAQAPEWLLEAIEALVVKHGSRPSGPLAHTTSSDRDFNAFKKRTNGREAYMRDMVWASVVSWRRKCPIPPPPAESIARIDAEWAVYERNVSTRLPPESGVSHAELLERENRGKSLFANKWRRAMLKWDGDVAKEAARPKPEASGFEAPPEEPKVDPRTGEPLPLLLSAEQFVAGFSPPAYLIDGVLQRGYLYSLTARTGHGKTAVALYVAQAIDRGVPMHCREVKAGTVLLLAWREPGRHQGEVSGAGRRLWLQGRRPQDAVCGRGDRHRRQDARDQG
jgi:hypothetical protein